VLDRPGLEGVVPNADLSPQHARILLALALGAGLGARAIRRVFAEY